MALTVNMPQLGESVTEGTIAKWLKQPGEHVAKYESIAEVITDKVNAEIPAPADGTMGELIAPEGAVVPVGQPICSIETDDAAAAPSAPAPAKQQAAPSPPAAAEVSEAAAPVPASAPVPEPAPAPAPAPEQPAQLQPVAQQAETAVATPSGNGNGASTYHVTPAVRMLVREHGVDLSQIQGSGIGGRISKKDVLEYVQRRDAGGVQRSAPAQVPAASPPQTQAPPPAAATAATATQPAVAQPAAAPGEGETIVPLTSVRRAIAEHMVRSRRTSPHAYVMVEVDMSAVSRTRTRARADFEKRYGVKLTYLPFVARAVCEALGRHPTLNASWSDEGIILKRDIHLGIAVALEDNLVVPVVRNADRLSLAGLATTMSDLGERARSNHLKLDEIQGGTFTLNNTGALGAVLTEAIINQPQAAIMTMDMVVKRAVVVENDAIAIRPIMNLGMSFDHRINDGLQATRFVRTVKDLLEGFDDSSALL
ncbi:MAG TPA: dihydrolipoamide acetyltransferase family protein [Candidatus Dormibacteraeota bacterium]